MSTVLYRIGLYLWLLAGRLSTEPALYGESSPVRSTTSKTFQTNLRALTIIYISTLINIGHYSVITTECDQLKWLDPDHFVEVRNKLDSPTRPILI